MELTKVSNTFYLFLLIQIVFFASCSNAQEKKQESLLLGSEKFQERLSQETKPQLIDVRTQSEYTNGSIDGAINYDFLDGTFQKELATLNKNRTVFVFCAKGGRSGKAAQLLKEKGFQSIVDLKGGYSAWVKK